MDIDVFGLLAEMGSIEEVQKKAIEQIESNSNVIYELNVYDRVIDEEVAKLLANIVFYGNQHKDRVQIKGVLNEKESKLITKEYVKLCGKDVKTDFKEIYAPFVIDID